jgi:hypothetical protein
MAGSYYERQFLGFNSAACYGVCGSDPSTSNGMVVWYGVCAHVRAHIRLGLLPHDLWWRVQSRAHRVVWLLASLKCFFFIDYIP